jgi:hypothetical protein
MGPDRLDIFGIGVNMQMYNRAWTGDRWLLARQSRIPKVMPEAQELCSRRDLRHGRLFPCPGNGLVLTETDASSLLRQPPDFSTA